MAGPSSTILLNSIVDDIVGEIIMCGRAFSQTYLLHLVVIQINQLAAVIGIRLFGSSQHTSGIITESLELYGD